MHTTPLGCAIELNNFEIGVDIIVEAAMLMMLKRSKQMFTKRGCGFAIDVEMSKLHSFKKID